MLKGLINWLGARLFGGRHKSPNQTRRAAVGVRPPAQRQAARHAPPPRPPEPAFTSDAGGRIEDGGPGKNILVRSKYVREDTGTHEVLKIVDESLFDSEPDDTGIDPYNTGRFDRSQSWNHRYRK